MIYIIDIILLILCIFLAALSAKKGFARTAMDFVFSILGTAVSWFAASRLCTVVYQSFFRAKLIEHISSSYTGKALDSVSGFLSAAPSWLMSSAVKLGIFNSTEEIETNLASKLTVENLEQTFFGPIAVFAVKAGIFVILSIILGIILKIISHVIGKRIRESSAKTADIVLGAILGLCKGLVLSLIVAALLYSISYAIPESSFTKYVDASIFCKVTASVLNLL